MRASRRVPTGLSRVAAPAANPPCNICRTDYFSNKRRPNRFGGNAASRTITPVHPDPTAMLIAHRGDRIRQQENTIAAFEGAHGLGACAIQTEIQYSADDTPWCFHEPHLHDPWSGKARPFCTLRDRELRRLPINSFAQVVDWASRHRHLDWFVELSTECIERMGAESAVAPLVRLLRPESDYFALMARDCRSLRLARNLGCHQVALKVDSVARSLSVEVVTLAPDYLLIRDSRVDCEELPPGPWQWVVYEINSAEEAVRWRARGAHHILTGNLPLLMRSREASDVYGF